MQVWFTVQEIADLATDGLLPGLPTTARGTFKMSERERWQDYPALARPRTGREGGGGWEYHLDILPMAVRLHYVAKSFRIDQRDLVAPLCDDGTTSAKAREIRDARIVIVRLADSFRRSTGLGARASEDYFTRLYNAGSIAIPDWLKAVVDTISVRTLARWRSTAREDTARLATDPSAARKGTGLLDTANDGQVRHFIFGLISTRDHLTARDILIQCRARFGEELVSRNGEFQPMPPERTFRHFIAKLKAENEAAITKIANPDKYRSHFALTGTNAFAWVKEPNQLWQIDASPVDVLCIDGRHSIYMCLDLATRRIVITTSKTPRASAVGLMTRKAILTWGAPRGIKTDNGSDFVAKETVRLFDALGIDVQTSTAYTPQEKGHVERVIKTFQHAAGPKLPGYIGHNVADRKQIESRRAFAERLGCDDADAFAVQLTAAQLQQYIDEWVEYDYSHKEHDGLGRLTPAQVAEKSTTVIRRVDERALDVLLMPVSIRVMTKRGFKIDGHYYHSPVIMPRTRALLRMDPMDAGKARAFSVDGDVFLADAVCYELAGVDPLERLKADRAAREKKISAITRPALEAVKHLTGTAIMDNHLAVLKRDAEQRAAETANVIRLPKREEVHSTPQIAAALDAIEESGRPARPAHLSDAAAESHRRLVAEFEGQPAEPANVVKLRVEETPDQRFRRMLDVELRRERGEPVTEEEAYQLGSYQLSSEYKTKKQLWEDFGDQAPALRT